MQLTRILDMHENKLKVLEEELAIPVRKLGEWKDTEREFLETWDRLNKYVHTKYKQHLYAEGDKACGMLAMLLHTETQKPPVVVVRNSLGLEVKSQLGKITFLLNLQKVYVQPCNAFQAGVATYLADLSMASLTERNKTHLDVPLPKEEIMSAIHAFQTSRAPGGRWPTGRVLSKKSLPLGRVPADGVLGIPTEGEGT
ncbi:hypothetical protein NDU88_004379 [Pleurodeles waltl]|uniref:Uncharacterized protein n=1 Tax=Pleurodeles waltl TaxID=8319 RepID=A0AAV7MTA6_PLEWA|nr:hypothetical protein NDU88_004379 [Pleurodeles waltl]